MIETEHPTVDLWLQDWARRRDAGHHLRGHDDVVNRTLGFIDINEETHVFITKMNAMVSGPRVQTETLAKVGKPGAKDWPRVEPRRELLHHEPTE